MTGIRGGEVHSEMETIKVNSYGVGKYFELGDIGYVVKSVIRGNDIPIKENANLVNFFELDFYDAFALVELEIKNNRKKSYIASPYNIGFGLGYNDDAIDQIMGYRTNEKLLHIIDFNSEHLLKYNFSENQIYKYSSEQKIEPEESTTFLIAYLIDSPILEKDYILLDLPDGKNYKTIRVEL